jgi:2-iminoacetate synthase ThiH
MKPFHIMAKPHGPICNLNCTYCYYLEKENLYAGSGREFRMADDVLETYIRQYIQSQPAEHVSFAWQGGEPTLLGIPFFERVVELQKNTRTARSSTTHSRPTARCLTMRGASSWRATSSHRPFHRWAGGEFTMPIAWTRAASRRTRA